MESDTDTTLDYCKQVIAGFISERDWDQFHHPKEVALSLNVEAGELLEIFQWTRASRDEIRADPEVMEEIRDEVADVFGYLLDLASRLDIDITQAYLKKMDKNRKKYPIHKSKGNHTKYTKL
jgi:NTP pyrophosphatase (non-canonical NTP hydrolase)